MLKNPFVLFVIVLLIILMFLPSYSKMQDLKKKNQEYKEQLRQLAEKNEELKKEKRRLIEDPVYLESIAREKMGIAREGEVIYRIKPMNAVRDSGKK